MPDRRGEAVLDDLPDDIIVGKILILLPPKDIGRCRMVRTSWRIATSTPMFMVEHRSRRPSLPIIDGDDGRPASLVIPRDAGASTQQLWPFLSRCDYSCCEISLHASRDGFLIVSRGDRLLFYICNPTTRKHALLPFPRTPPVKYSFYTYDTYIHGLYQHKSTGDYRVLWSRVYLDHKKGATLYVLTVGANESRSIQVVMPTLPPASLEQKYDIIRRLCLTPSPVHHRGNLHWLLFRPDLIHGNGNTEDIIVFDTEAESFRWMRNPAHDHMMNRLFDMEGTLAFLRKSGPKSTITTMDVWVMQDYEAETWAFKYRIDVSMIEASWPLDLTFPEGKYSPVRSLSEMAVLNERELLVGFNEKRALRCDTDGKFLGMVTIGEKQDCMYLTSHCLQESIMPIPSGEMQGEEEEFPFSTEHV